MYRAAAVEAAAHYACECCWDDLLSCKLWYCGCAISYSEYLKRVIYQKNSILHWQRQGEAKKMRKKRWSQTYTHAFVSIWWSMISLSVFPFFLLFLLYTIPYVEMSLSVPFDYLHFFLHQYTYCANYATHSNETHEVKTAYGPELSLDSLIYVTKIRKNKTQTQIIWAIVT